MAAILLFLTILTVSGKNCFILASESNCTYNFEFQNANDDVTCHKYAETKSQGLRQHILLLEERLGKLKSTQNLDDNGQCKEKKEYAISYTGEIKFDVDVLLFSCVTIDLLYMNEFT